MKKIIAQTILIFLLLEIITGIVLMLLPHDAQTASNMRHIVVILHKYILSFAYLSVVLLHCWMLRGSIVAQLKLGRLDAKYVIILALLLLSFLAFVPGKVFGPWPLSFIVHGIAIPSGIAVLIYVHILVQKKAKAEREAASLE